MNRRAKGCIILPGEAATADIILPLFKLLSLIAIREFETSVNSGESRKCLLMIMLYRCSMVEAFDTSATRHGA